MTKFLSDQAGIQYDAPQDKSESSSPERGNAVIFGNFKRGRYDKPMKITLENMRAKLGFDPWNAQYQAIEDLLKINSGGHVWVQRLSEAAPELPAIPEPEPEPQEQIYKKFLFVMNYNPNATIGARSFNISVGGQTYNDFPSSLYTQDAEDYLTDPIVSEKIAALANDGFTILAQAFLVSYVGNLSETELIFDVNPANQNQYQLIGVTDFDANNPQPNWPVTPENNGFKLNIKQTVIASIDFYFQTNSFGFHSITGIIATGTVSDVEIGQNVEITITSPTDSTKTLTIQTPVLSDSTFDTTIDISSIYTDADAGYSFSGTAKVVSIDGETLTDSHSFSIQQGLAITSVSGAGPETIINGETVNVPANSTVTLTAEKASTNSFAFAGYAPTSVAVVNEDGTYSEKIDTSGAIGKINLTAKVGNKTATASTSNPCLEFGSRKILFKDADYTYSHLMLSNGDILLYSGYGDFAALAYVGNTVKGFTPLNLPTELKALTSVILVEDKLVLNGRKTGASVTNQPAVYMQNGDKWDEIILPFSTTTSGFIRTLKYFNGFMFALTSTGTFYISKDLGKNWVTDNVVTTKYSSFDESIIEYIGNTYYCYNYNNLCTSTDGENWVKQDEPYTNYSAKAMFAIGNDAFIFYNDSKIYKSSDGGVTWTNVQSVEKSSIEQMPNFLQLEDRLQIYTALYILETLDNGETWQFKTRVDSSNRFFSVAYANSAIYALFGSLDSSTGINTSVYIKKSVDNGETWASAPEFSDFSNATKSNLIIFDEPNNKLLINGADTLMTVYDFTTGVYSKTVINGGKASPTIRATSTDGNTIVVACSGGGTRTFTNLNAGIDNIQHHFEPPVLITTPSYISYTNGKFIVLTTFYTNSGNYNTVISSSDDGITWSHSPVIKNDADLRGNGTGRIVYLNGNYITTGTSIISILTSPDAKNWTEKRLNYSQKATLQHGNRLIAAYLSNTFYESLDGFTWTTYKVNGLDSSGYSDSVLKKVGNKLITFKSNYLSYSDDGINWVSMQLFSGTIYDLVYIESINLWILQIGSNYYYTHDIADFANATKALSDMKLDKLKKPMQQGDYIIQMQDGSTSGEYGPQAYIYQYKDNAFKALMLTLFDEQYISKPYNPIGVALQSDGSIIQIYDTAVSMSSLRNSNLAAVFKPFIKA